MHKHNKSSISLQKPTFHLWTHPLTPDTLHTSDFLSKDLKSWGLMGPINSILYIFLLIQIFSLLILVKTKLNNFPYILSQPQGSPWNWLQGLSKPSLVQNLNPSREIPRCRKEFHSRKVQIKFFDRQKCVQLNFIFNMLTINLPLPSFSIHPFLILSNP